VDLAGRLLMPALINCHTHLYSTLARGMHVPGPPPVRKRIRDDAANPGQTPNFRRSLPEIGCLSQGLPRGTRSPLVVPPMRLSTGLPPADFPAILKKLWWRLDRAIDEEDVYYSALIGLIDSARCGVGTVIDHHASPSACAGSLDSVERAFHEVGLRGATCYETSDRNGRRGAQAGIRENVRFLERVRPGAQVGGMFGLHASFTLSDRTLAACVEANQSLAAGFHVHVAEDVCDRLAVRRLCQAGVLDQKALAAHCIHIAAAERAMLARRRVNVVHNPQSNCNNAVGIANLPALFRLGVRVGLGSDGYSPRMWDEFKVATHLQKVRASDARVGGAEAYAALFSNNRDIVKQIWGTEVGRIESGARADLLLVDYHPPTPLDSSNLFGHLLFGVSNAPVDSLMVNGRWVLRDGRCVNLDERAIAEKAAARAKAMWERF
jgi:putative selenium metabolism protein SsnA